MTDREALLELLGRFGLHPSDDLGANTPHEDVVLAAKHGGVEGYDGFIARFEFEPDGRFAKLRLEE